MMRKTAGCVLTLVFTLLFSTYCLASFNQSDWKYYKELPVKGDGFAAISLDPDVMRNCQENFNDLRVTDQQGREIASQVIQPDKGEVETPATLLDSIEYPAYSSLVLDLGSAPQKRHNRITLTMEVAKDYLRAVTLEASQDNQSWGQIGQGKIMSFNEEQSGQLSPYPTSTARYLRVNIKQAPGENPLRLVSAQVSYLPVSLYDGKLIAAKTVSLRSDRSTTNIVLDLQAPNYFLNRVELATPDRNFNRLINISTGAKAAVTGSEMFFKPERILTYQWGDYSSVKNTIEINQYGRRFLFLAIDNGNSPPLKITGIKVYASTPVLMADLQGPSRLWYGNPKAGIEDYDLNLFANLIAKSDLKLLSPDVQQLNPDYKAPVVPWTEQNKWLLDTLIVLVAAGFIFFILKNFKRMRDEVDN